MLQPQRFRQFVLSLSILLFGLTARAAEPKLCETWGTAGTSPIVSLAYSPDGKILAARNNDGGIALWSVATGKMTAKLDSTGNSTLAFSPDSKTLASGGYVKSGGQSDDRDSPCVELWDVSNGQKTRILSTGPVSSVSFSPDGKTLAEAGDAGGGEGRIELWNLLSGTRLAAFQNHVYRPRISNAGWCRLMATFAPDGKSLASAGNDGITLLDIATKNEAILSDEEFAPISVAFSGEGKTFAVSTCFRDVTLCDIAKGKRKNVRYLTDTRALSVAFSPDGQTLRDARRNRSQALGSCHWQANCLIRKRHAGFRLSRI